ncbi:hypothetical protein [Larkinella punicea]|uniref:Outer membrane protein beta-barrel domain-containing protein n=1 Tax=Larkinella punicea TaxID=2315727 RepID=A0A368JM16_9BACT|nr:hypothetical protein [Larkinella punicea]RCR68562.1 hypothetical protein DUE52_15705 [Larkinella punicea]
MKHLLFLLAGCLFSFSGQAQKHLEWAGKPNPAWKAEVVSQHQKGSWLTGAGLTVLGTTAKVGYFAANRWWIGAEGELHNLLSTRLEGGLFARYYLWNGSLLSGFALGGVSYGRFQGWDWDIDFETPGSPTRYSSTKLNAGLGLEMTLSRRLALEGVGKVGKLTDAGWFQPSVQLSLNVYLGRR